MAKIKNSYKAANTRVVHNGNIDWSLACGSSGKTKIKAARLDIPWGTEGRDFPLSNRSSPAFLQALNKSDRSLWRECKRTQCWLRTQGYVLLLYSRESWLRTERGRERCWSINFFFIHRVGAASQARSDTVSLSLSLSVCLSPTSVFSSFLSLFVLPFSSSR